MIGIAGQGLPDPLNGVGNGSLTGDLKAEVAGNGIDSGSVERNAAAIDCSNQLSGAGILGERGSLAE
jgi:hypothetical protein